MTKEQWNLFDDLPGITLVMTWKMKHNPPRNIGDDAHLALHLFRPRTPSPDHVSEPAIENELSEPAKHEQQNPIIDPTEDEAPSEHAKSKRRRYNMVSPFCDIDFDDDSRQNLVSKLIGLTDGI